MLNLGPFKEPSCDEDYWTAWYSRVAKSNVFLKLLRFIHTCIMTIRFAEFWMTSTYKPGVLQSILEDIATMLRIGETARYLISWFRSEKKFATIARAWQHEMISIFFCKFLITRLMLPTKIRKFCDNYNLCMSVQIGCVKMELPYW